MEAGHTYDTYVIVSGLKLERGDILDMFSKLEFFINELIQLKLLGANSDKGLMLDDILEYVDFFSRIKLLNEWSIIDGSLSNDLNQTKQVRNGLAHLWDISEVTYKGNSLRSCFPQFKSDMEKIWKELLKLYSVEMEKIDIDKIKDEIRAFNV